MAGRRRAGRVGRDDHHVSLRQEGDYAIVMFSHDGWREQVPFMNHCSTKWAVFLLSLKALIESGKGTPAPRDVAVSDWH